MNNPLFHYNGRVQVITTGGTIEKIYSEEDGTLENRGSFIKNKILSKLRLPYTDIEVHSLMSKDSLFMDDRDREKICKLIADLMKNQQPIVVLHGTDTMTLTAEFCLEKLPASVPVVFTGAMKPMGFDDSDATQNVTEALLAAKLLPVGYYLSFHNQIFKVPGVKKNPLKRTFELI